MNSNEKINEIEKVYNDFFGECEKTNRCGQVDLKKEFDKNTVMYDHGIQFSENYFDMKYKILVVGLSSRGSINEKARCVKLDPGKYPHWKGTALVSILFNNEKLSNDEMDDIEKNIEKRTELCQNTEFAFTDFYKCAFSKDGTHHDDVKYSTKMQNNCLELFKKEIEFLDPSLILVQGINNKKIIDIVFGDSGEEIPYDDGNERMGMWKYGFNGKAIYVIISPFPANQTHPNSQWNTIKFNVYELIRLCKKRLINGG